MVVAIRLDSRSDRIASACRLSGRVCTENLGSGVVVVKSAEDGG